MMATDVGPGVGSVEVAGIAVDSELHVVSVCPLRKGPLHPFFPTIGMERRRRQRQVCTRRW
jgi:hypothetical protein